MFEKFPIARTRRLLALGSGLVALSLCSYAGAQERTWNFLTTGNGRGFQVFDANQYKVVEFLEHPYRYLRPKPDPKSDGVGRRNLAFDVFFGLRASGGAGWTHEGAKGVPSYLDQTNIIVAPSTVAGVNADSHFFSPFGYEGNAMIGVLHAPGATDGFILLNFHMGPGETSPSADGESMAPVGDHAVQEIGPGGGAMVYVALNGVDAAECGGVFAKVNAGQDLTDSRSCSGNDVVMGLQKRLTDGWMAVAVEFVENPADAPQAVARLDAWAAQRPPAQILDDTKAEWEAWRKPPPPEVMLVDDDYRKLWRQSEVVLRMGQVTEPYTPSRKNTGMVLASLPPGSWHSGWVRDAIYAIVAFARTGHHAEAKLALDFFLNATEVGKFKSFVNNQDYQISVCRYFGNGEEEADYSGQPSPNVETDGWGMVLWAARQYIDASGDIGWLSSSTARQTLVYDALVQGVANPMEGNLESNGIMRADSSIWETHDHKKRHFAYTTMAAARGFCDMAAIAKRAGRTDDVTKYQNLAKTVRDGFLTTFKNTQGALVGSLEGVPMGWEADGAVAEAFTWNILSDYQGTTAQETLNLLEQLRVSSGGFKRNQEALSSYDNHEWILVDFRMADSMHRMGRTQDADAMVDAIVRKAAANFFLVPELYSADSSVAAIGSYTGEVPMVGYGAGAYMLTLMDRYGLIEPNDCGTVDPVITDGGPVVYPDSGGVQTEGGVDPFGGGDDPELEKSDENIPYKSACLCRLELPRSTPGGLPGLILFPAVLFLRRFGRPKP